MDGHSLGSQGILDRLGASIPIIAAPMAGGPSTARLVVAAANAGGLGFLAAGYKSAAQMTREIQSVRRSTDRFGVNLFVPSPVGISAEELSKYERALARAFPSVPLDTDSSASDFTDDWDAKIKALLTDPVPVVSFTFGSPSAEVVSGLREVGSITVQTVTNAAEAAEAASRGIDALVVQGAAAGGHSATFTPETLPTDVPLTVLVDQVVSAVQLPVWAAGGLAMAAQVRDVLDAGAEAAVVGTVLLRSHESGAAEIYKDALGDPNRQETVVTTAFTGRPARALRNAFVDAFDKLAPIGYPEVHYLTSPIRRAAAAAGDAENLNLWAGTGHRYASLEPATNVMRRLAAVDGRSPSATVAPAAQRAGRRV